MENNLTTFQKIYRALNLGSNRVKYDTLIDKKEIIKANSVDELKFKELEMAQQIYLDNQFYKITYEEYQRQLVAQANRDLAYYDYMGMEHYPIIKSAIDLVTDETLAIGDDGKLLNIYSENSRIKKTLEDLFYNVLDINANIYQWTRNLVKYGEDFLYLKGDLNNGIVDTRKLISHYMKREEKKVDNDIVTKFINIENGGHQEYNTFQIAHFRLLGDDTFLPYGTSYFSGVRRIWKQLVQAEDLLMVYRMTRTSERNLYHVEVGNINPNDRKNYIQKVASTFKKSQKVDRDNANIDFKYDVIAPDEDFFSPMVGGKKFVEFDKIPPAANLESITDIEYLRENLYNGLGIPKPFLSFAEASGEGKSMTIMDIRFAKRIARIQRSLIQEFNKIAMIHLMLLKFDDGDITNFKLSMNYPSVQADIQKVERFKEKMNLYAQLTTKEDGGWAAMSKTNAKKKFLGMSDDEIIEDIKKQYAERIIDQELQDVSGKMKVTGLFSDVSKKFEPLNNNQEEGTGLENKTETTETPENTEEPKELSENKLDNLIKNLNISPNNNPYTQKFLDENYQKIENILKNK